MRRSQSPPFSTRLEGSRRENSVDETNRQAEKNKDIRLGALDGIAEEGGVVPLQSHANEREDNVNFATSADSLFDDLLVGLNSLILERESRRKKHQLR